MNESELKRWCLEHAGEPMPPEAEAYLRDHPETARNVERLALVSKLMSLKGHETPDPHLAGRCAARVRERIESEKRRSWLHRLEDALTLHPAPVWAGAAAALVLGAGLWIGLHSAPESTPLASTAAEPEPEPVALVADAASPAAETGITANALASTAAPIPLNEKPILVLRVESNPGAFGPGGIDYGIGGTMPVSFER